MDKSPFSGEELARYSRQLSLPQVGPEGQEKLRSGKVLIVGVGGLGSPAALYLAAAGVGTIGIVDPDVVELSNLHRQVLYDTRDIGAGKVVRARERLLEANPHLKVHAHRVAFTRENALQLVRDFDVVVDGTDSFETRYLVNDASVITGKPNVYASVLRFEGQLSVFGHEGGPCYRCVYPEPPPQGSVPNCAEAGVLGVLPGVMGMLQATEAIKILLGEGRVASGRLLLFDAMSMTFRTIGLRRARDCRICGEGALPALGDYGELCANPQTEIVGAVQLIEARELASQLSTRADQVELLDVREEWEHEIARIPGSKLIPLREIEGRLDELSEAGKTVIVYCHHGARSAAAAQLIASKCRLEVRDLIGGIDEYSRMIDPAIPRY
ncbi:MAG: molybdopterin-synthase adenylyltransferase MoeB [Gemmatimonadota bacterium]